MSSAHGAGLMLLPMVMPMSVAGGGPRGLHHRLADGRHAHLGLRAHVTAVALLVYTKVGVRFLRTAWLNVDAVWAGALILTGLIAFLT